MLAPIALFVYNRPRHTKQTIEALCNNILAEQSDLIIFSDGPKTHDAMISVAQVRTLIKAVGGFKSVRVIESDNNKGLANSIIHGVTEVLTQYESLVVLEDDMVTSPLFLSYMNEGLNLYEKDEDVISIHAYNYPVKKEMPQSFFIKGADCWGWATWRRGWALFERDGKKLLDEITARNLTAEFDFNSNYPFTKMLADQIIGKNDSWAIRWQASAFLKNKLTLYPGIAFLKNIGFDNSGTHSNNYDTVFDTNVQMNYSPLHRIGVQESK